MAEWMCGWTVVAVTLTLNVFMWRLFPRYRSVRSLLVLFGVGLSIGAALVLLGVLPSPTFPVGIARALLLSVTVFLVYLSLYSGTELDSPSGVVLMYVEQGGSEGIAREELFTLMNDEDLILSRLDNMVRSRWVTCEDDVYRLAMRGRLFIGLVRITRRVFTRNRVGG